MADFDLSSLFGDSGMNFGVSDTPQPSVDFFIQSLSSQAPSAGDYSGQENFWDYPSSEWMGQAPSAGGYSGQENFWDYPSSEWMGASNQMTQAPQQGSVIEQILKGLYGEQKGSQQGGQPNQVSKLAGALGLGVGGLTALESYLKNRKLSKMAQQQFSDQSARAAEDRAYAMEKRTKNDALNGAFDTTVTPRNYVAIDPSLAAKYGRLSGGSVYAPSMYDKSLPTVAITPRTYSASTNVLNKASGGVIPSKGALGLLRGGDAGQADTVPANVSHGEYVMDADIVSALGDGNTDAGAAKLDEMRANIRQHKRSAPSNKIPPKSKSPLAYMKKGAK